MVAKIDAPYNTIFGSLLLNKLYAVLSPRYLMMKFKTNNGIASVRRDQVKAKSRCMLFAKAAMK